MKKWEMLKRAYEDYQKGVKFFWPNDTFKQERISSGRFKIIEDHGIQIVDETDDLSAVFSFGVWATIVREEKPKIEVDLDASIKISNEKEYLSMQKFCKENRYYYSDSSWNSWTNENVFFNLGDSSITIKPSQNYVVNFQDFAKEHGIKMPLLVSEDNVPLFEGDKYYYAINHFGKWISSGGACVLFDKGECGVLTIPETHKAFSTKKAALEWVKKHNKPKEIEIYFPSCNSEFYAKVSKEQISFHHKKLGELSINKLRPSDIQTISNALKQLNNEK